MTSNKQLKSKVIYFYAIILLILFIPNVTAYNTLTSFGITDTGTYSGSTAVHQISVQNAAYLPTITKVSMAGQGHCHQTLSISCTGNLTNASGKRVATASYTFTGTSTSSYTAPFTAELLLSNYDPSFVDTGTKAYTIVCANGYDLNGKVNWSDTGWTGTGIHDNRYGVSLQVLNGLVGGTYSVYSGYPDVAGSFTAIPASGNQSLNVTFTPTVSGYNLNRVVWDFDGGLGTETKYTNLSTQFNKVYSTAGHYVARMTVYDGVGASATASQNIDVYNYTLGITPTPTLTPVPTGTPISSQNQIVVNVYDQTNITLVSSVSISMIDTSDSGAGWKNVTSNNGTYAFSTYGTANANLVSGHSYMFVVSKTGYATATQVYPFVGPQADTVIYLTPSVYTPVASNFALLVQLKDAATGDNILTGRTGTVIISNQSSSWVSTYSNPNSGTAMFGGLTPGASYKIEITLTGHKSYIGYFASSVSMGGTTQTFNAYLESSGIPSGSYTISVNPRTGTYNDTYMFTLGGDTTNTQQIDIMYLSSDMSSPMPFTTTGGYTQWRLIGGAWKIWTGSTWAASSKPVLVGGKFGNHGIDNVYDVKAYFTSASQIYSATSDITVQSSGYVPIGISVWGGTGPVNGMLLTFNTYIQDVYSGTWYNKSWTPADIGTYLYFSPGTLLRGYATAPNHAPSITKQLLVSESGPNSIQWILNPLSPINYPVDNVTLYVETHTFQGTPIANANVQLSDGSLPSFTNNNGRCYFVVLNNTYYSATATAAGYLSSTSGITTDGLNQTNTIDIYMLPGVQTTATIPSWVVTPTMQPIETTAIPTIPGGSQLNWSGTATTCGSNSTNVVEQVKSNLACAGFADVMAQNLALSALIIIIFMLVGGRYGKAIGSGAGAIIGFVLSFAMGLLPFMLVALLIVLLILFGAILLLRSPG